MVILESHGAVEHWETADRWRWRHSGGGAAAPAWDRAQLHRASCFWLRARQEGGCTLLWRQQSAERHELTPGTGTAQPRHVFGRWCLRGGISWCVSKTATAACAERAGESVLKRTATRAYCRGGGGDSAMRMIDERPRR